MPTRPVRLALFAGCLAALAALLAACASPTPAAQRGAWEGTSTSADGAFPLTIATTLSAAGGWTGTYTLARAAPFSGRVDGTLVNGVLEGALVVSDACRFGLVGTVTGDALEATFAPTGCPGGAEGTWTATRTTPGPLPDPPGDDAASFDGGATFDTARFR